MTGPVKRLAAFVVDETTLFLRTWSRRKTAALVMVEAAGTFRLFERRRGAVRHLADGTVDEIAAKHEAILRRRPVELRVDPGRVVDRTIRIPAASRLYADAVVLHQLDRIAPFAPNKVVFDFEERGSHGEGATAEIELRVVVIARDVLAALREACAGAGIRLCGVGVAGGPLEAPGAVELALPAEALETVALRARVGRALSALLVLGIAAGAGTFLFADMAAREGASLSQRIETTRAAAIERRRDSETPRNPVLALKRRDGGFATAIIVNELSRILPEGTYLTALAVEDHKLRLTGLSTRASDLVGIVEASDLFDATAFTAPVLRGQAGGLERFEILANFGGPVS